MGGVWATFCGTPHHAKPTDKEQTLSVPMKDLANVAKAIDNSSYFLH